MNPEVMHLISKSENIRKLTRNSKSDSENFSFRTENGKWKLTDFKKGSRNFYPKAKKQMDQSERRKGKEKKTNQSANRTKWNEPLKPLRPNFSTQGCLKRIITARGTTIVRTRKYANEIMYFRVKRGMD